MKCECCKISEASVHVKQAFNGEARELHLCEECATRNGIDIQSPMGLTDFLFGIEVQQEGKRAVSEKACPKCKWSHGDFRKNTRLGCPACYKMFADELVAVLGDFQKGHRHVGKVPASAQLGVRLSSLERQLRDAVTGEKFEEAARLRDLIRDLKAEREAVES